jgi:hypothetical protein
MQHPRSHGKGKLPGDRLLAAFGRIADSLLSASIAE